ncbi:MAG: hypothetical protein BMS9Abin05_1610 [Rhodothermia bacterium]|nr:MAG: hypothetical protein BMS9Abin05_1610 [Rhodothermia bacterium]
MGTLDLAPFPNVFRNAPVLREYYNGRRLAFQFSGMSEEAAKQNQEARAPVISDITETTCQATISVSLSLSSAKLA